MILCFCTACPQHKPVLKVLDWICMYSSESVDMSECIHYVCAHHIIQEHMVKDKKLILTMRTENRWLSVSQPHSANRYDSSKLSGPIKPDSLWQTQLVVTVLRLSEEIHVILNRFYIARVIIFLSDFADSGLGHSSDGGGGALFAHKGANSLQYLLCRGSMWTESWLRCTAVTQTAHWSCKYDNSGITVCWSLRLTCIWVYCSNKALKQSCSFCSFISTHAFPFTSEINFPPWYTNLAVSSPFFSLSLSSCSRQETNTGGFVLYCGGGWGPPPSNSTWCWEMRRETGVTHDLQFSNTTGLTITGGNVLTSYFAISLLIISPAHWQILGNPTLPRLSSKIISIRVEERSGLCV